jgi:hypothetical protein
MNFACSMADHEVLSGWFLLSDAGHAPAPSREAAPLNEKARLKAAWDKHRNGEDLPLRKASLFAAGFRAALAQQGAAATTLYRSAIGEVLPDAG